MFAARVTVISLAVIVAIAACTNASQRYSITDSKAYEASLFRQNCAICHGPEADGRTFDDGRIVPNLRNAPYKYSTDQQIYDHIANGGNGMVPFRDQLSDSEIRRMVEFVQRDLRHNAARSPR